MPLPGGEADKLGNRYEGRWTIHCMIDVMDEKADSIRIESPGEDAFEFFLWRDRQKEYHQVKRQNSQLGHWTLNSLEKKQITVLSDIWKYLQNSDVTCVFVSTQDADELGELASRAQGAKSLTEFEQKFINGKIISGKFDTLRQKWNTCSAQAAYQALKRVRVETVGENFLVDSIENRLATLVEGDPTTIRIELAELILNSIHQKLTAHNIWHYLIQERGYSRREWGKAPHVLAAVKNINDRYVSRLKDVAIANSIITRDETQTILQKLNSNDGKRALLVTGEAGVGKSVVMLQVLKQLLKQGIPVLSFRVDNLNPVADPDDVGKQLQLPGSPTTVLASFAQKRECVLVIDQLDAVSLTSGRHPDFFECINEIIQQALIHPNINLLVACRKFDLDNDHRLKKLTGEKDIVETIIINRLSHEKVKEVVTELNLDATRLNPKQLDLLSIPLHLWLLSEIAEDSNFNTLNFQTAKDLFDRFWKYKPRQLRNRLGRDIKWTQVIDLICDRMSDKQSLSVPQTIVDDFQADAEAMASEHILVKDNKQLRFFHDSFFDYAFARRFAARGEDFLSLLRSSEQHLFRRTQVRQILIHERETDFDSYLEHLEELLTSDDIRFHIKQIVFGWLGTLDDPKEEEWEILSPIFECNNAYLTHSAWLAICNSISWFELLASLGLITQWLNSNQEQNINRVIYLMWNVQKEVPEIVAKLLNPYVNLSEEWDKCINRIINRSELGKNRKIFEFFLHLVKKGFFDGKSKTINNERDFWSQIYSLPRQNSDWACEAIGSYLDRYLVLSVASGKANLFDRNGGIFPYSQSAEEVIRESAENSPYSFVGNILPFIFKIIKLTVKSYCRKPWQDEVWRYRHWGSYYQFKDILLNCLENALRNLAINQSERCSEIIERKLKPYQNFKTIQYLLIRTYAANGLKFADDAVDFICQEPIRLATGYDICNGNTHAAPYWVTRQLLIEIIPHCSSTKLNKLENLLLNYYPIWNERDKDRPVLNAHLYDVKLKILIFRFLPKSLPIFYWLSCHQYLQSLVRYAEHTRHLLGYAQFVLLESFIIATKLQLQNIFTKIFSLAYSANSKYGKISYLILLNNIKLFSLNETIIRRLGEWQRKFKSLGLIEELDVVKPPEAIEACGVGSPIVQESANYMTDEEWLKAISKYSQGGIHSDRDGLLIGGALELSRTLEDCVKKEPVRFARLIWQLPDNTNTYYFDAILRGIAKATVEVDLETAFSVCQRCERLPQKPCGRWISSLVGDLADLSWSRQALDMLICYALNDPDPAQKLWSTEALSGQVDYSSGILTAGINSVRGAAVRAITKLIFADKTRGAYFQHSLEQIVRDKSIAVRSCAAEALIAMLNYNRDLAVNLFLQLCKTEDIILSTQTIDRFLYYATYTHFETLKPILERMIYSDNPKIVEIGARQSCLAALGTEEAKYLADYCLSGTTAHRKALAQVLVGNFKSAHFRQYCEDRLITLFNDSEQDVRSQAARWFFELREDELQDYTNLVKHFVKSSAFATDSHDLIYALEKTTAKLPEVTYLVCDRFVQNLKAQPTEQRSYSRDADEISQLLIRFYSQSRRQMRSQCLDLIDRLCEMNVYGLDKALHEYEK